MAAGFAQEMQSVLDPARTVIEKVMGQGKEVDPEDSEPATDLRQLFARAVLGRAGPLERSHHAALRPGHAACRSADRRLRGAAPPVEEALKITREISEYSLIGRARPGHEVCQMIPLIESIHDELAPLIEHEQIRVVFDLHRAVAALRCRAALSRGHSLPAGQRLRRRAS